METQTKKFFIAEYLFKEKVYHGGIGNVDVERTLLNNGFIPVQFPYQKEFSAKAKFSRFTFLFKTILSLPAHAILVFQMPLFANISKWIIRLVAFRKSIKLVCILTDIDGLKDGNDFLLQKELNFVENVVHFIAHNDAMKKWVISKLPDSKVKNLEFFPFSATTCSGNRKKLKAIAFAGNLGKSKFLNDLGSIFKSEQSLHFYLYGEGYQVIGKSLNIFYEGVFEPYDLPEKLIGSFGLVWDGDSIDGNHGIFGNYIRYISPHKLSLYVVSGLPVIAHKEAACASLIHKYQIGFTVNNLYEVADKIDSLTDDEYSSMQENCFRLSPVISSGDTLMKALKQLEIFS